MGWRDHLPIHPAADLFPLMSESELWELGESIRTHGLKSHLKLHKGKLLDGRNRLEAMELVGLQVDLSDDVAALGCPFDHLDEQIDPYDYVIAVNLHRRHLTDGQRRDLIAQIIKAKPEASDRAIAQQVKRDHKAVAKVRKKLESTGEVSPVQKRIGADGKRRAKKKARLDAADRAEARCAAEWRKFTAEEERTTESAEISIEQRRADHAAIADDKLVPTEAEAEESYQQTLFDQSCLLLSEMADETRQRFLDYLIKNSNRIFGRTIAAAQMSATNAAGSEGVS